MRILSAMVALLLTVCLLASCDGKPGPDGSGESSAAGSPAADSSSVSPEAPDGSEAPEGSAEAEAEGSETVSLPPPEAIVLLYTDYLKVQTRQDGLVYEYTYCFDEEQRVFNAIAVIRFPTEEEALREYNRLRMNSYPNLVAEGSSLSFCFPRKECPFYGISYRSLEVLLEETVYEIVERHPPEEPSESSEV